MPIEFRCPHCQRLLRVPDGSQGKQAQCPQCQAMVQVPGPGAAPPPAAGAGAPPAGAAGNPFTGTPRPPAAGAASGNPFTTNFPASAASAETGNPYQAPASSMLAPQVHAGPGVYPIVPTRMDLGDVLNRSWAIFKSQLGMLVLVVFAVLAINFGSGMISSAVLQGLAVAIGDPVVIGLMNGVAQIVLTVFQTWLNLGQLIFMIKVARGRPAEFSDIFTGGPYLLRAIGATILIILLTLAIAVPCLGPAGVIYLATQDQQITVIAFVIGMVILMPVMIFISLSIAQFQALIVDRNLGVMDSLRTSYEIMSGNRLTLLVLGILFFILNFVGVLACCVGLLFSFSYGMLSMTVAYLVMTGQPTADQLLTGAVPPIPPTPTV